VKSSTKTEKVWTTTKTKKTEAKTVNKVLNRLTWLSVLLTGLTSTFASTHFPLFKQSSSWMAALIILGVLGMLFIARFTNEGTKGWQFILDARLEIRRVSWPTRQETIYLTLIILVIVVVTSLFIYFLGLLFVNLIKWILI